MARFPEAAGVRLRAKHDHANVRPALREAPQVVAVTDPTQVGFTRQAMIGVRTEGDPMKVGDLLAQVDEVDYVVTTAGSFDLLVEVVCEDDPHLLDVIRQVREIEGVVSSETFVYLKLNKQHYNWGTR